MLPSTASLKQTGGRELKRIVFDEETIARRVRELGQEITAAYPGGEVLVLGLLKGSFIFLSDLVRRIERPLQVDFLVAASYGADTISSGNVRLLYDPETELRVSTSSWWRISSIRGRPSTDWWRSYASARRGAWRSVRCCISIWPSISSSSRRSSGSTLRECSSWGTGSITPKTFGTCRT